MKTIDIRGLARSLRKVKAAPVICPSCNHSLTLTQRDKELDQALVASTCLDRTQRELSLLERLERLFARFPASRHYLKIRTLTNVAPEWSIDGPQWKNTSDDPEFEAALRSEPDLYEFLLNTWFLLPARLPALRQDVKDMQRMVDKRPVLCSVCNNGRVLLEPEFFKTLFTVIFDSR